MTSPHRAATSAGRLRAAVLLALLPGLLGDAAAASDEPVEARCATCHPEISDRYRASAKARSLQRPAAGDPARAVEDLTSTLFHPTSRRYYEMRRDGDGYRFRRYQLGPDGEPINTVELPVDWILGSGAHARLYLTAGADGELYELPIAWYAEGGWGMAPGYDRADHAGVSRRLDASCLFCHGGGPGSTDVARSAIGCRRCHGPGDRHAELAAADAADPREVREAIVNPARLPTPLREDVCSQCHLQPSSAVAPMPVFDRGDDPFRPGEALTDRLVPIEVEIAGGDRADRFEVNHHGYRLRQSRCYPESAGRLDCAACHDPHGPEIAATVAARARGVCLGCHAEGPWPGEEGHPEADSDCVSCHMPPRRAQDMVHVVMTDHRIGVHADAKAALEPRAETVPRVVATEPYFPDRTPAGGSGELYSLLALLATGRSQDAVALVAERLASESTRAREPRILLLEGQIRTRLFADAEATARRLLEERPDDPRVLSDLAVALANSGRGAEALERLREAVRLAPDQPEPALNLALLTLADGDSEGAAERLERVTELRPGLATAWYFLADALTRLERHAPAAEALRRALAIDPGNAHTYLVLGQTLAASGVTDGALRTLRHGQAVTGDPRLEAEIARLESGGG